jgi:hypothetical protein
MAAPAFAGDAIFGFDLATPDITTASGVNTAALGELSAPTLMAIGNVAFIGQETSGSVAVIDQLGATNFAAIAQQTAAALGTIYQIGDSNFASINQH